MHSSLDPADLSHHDGFAAGQIEHSGWTCSSSDNFSTTEFSYDNGQLVDVHHSALDAGADYGGQDLNYASTVDSISQGIDLHHHSIPDNDFNPSFDLSHHHQLETPRFESHLSTADRYPEFISSSGADSLSAMPRSGASPDYAEADRNEGWAKHCEDSAKSWASEGSLSMAASRQADAEYYHAKAAESLDR
jgi:hypothetical protein